jgi:5-formyltetrahydrofolate cyclo-ligase
METKIALRKKYSKLRSEIKPSYRSEAALLATKHFLEMPFIKENLTIACYLPTQYEFDSTAIIDALWKIKCHCYLPILTEEKKLKFVLYRYGDKLRKNQFSILEPVDQTNTIDPANLDIVITPLVAFDNDGHRLGTGGGYYDQTFGFLLEGYITKPFLVGLAFESQKADSLPYDPWDINLDGILTEKGFARPFM